MTPQPAPVVEGRTVEEFACETATLVEHYTGKALEPKSPGDALVQLFARMAEVVGERLNRAPDRNFLAFLDLLGLDRLPPQPARTPLTFALAAGAPGDALVPAGTQVGALPLPGDTVPVVFETERDVVVTRTELAYAYVRDPRRDGYGERPRGVLPAGAPVPPLWEESGAAGHTLYLSYPVLAVKGPKQLVLALAAGERGVPWPRYVRWSVYDGGRWKPLEGAWDEAAWQVRFDGVEAVALAAVAGSAEPWIRADLLRPLRQAGLPPVDMDAAPSARHSDDSFYPFGETLPPTPLEVQFPPVPAGARVRVDVVVLERGTQLGGTVITVEYGYASAPSGWATLGLLSAQGGTAGGLEDGTLGLTRTGTISFTAPADWVSLDPTAPDELSLRMKVAQGGYDAPVPELPRLGSITIGYEWTVPALATVTAQVRMSGAPAPVATAFANQAPVDLTKDFFPFGQRPAFGDTLYLALPELADKPGARATLQVALSNPGVPGGTPAPAAPRQTVLRWEFWNVETGRWDLLGESGTAEALETSPYGFADETRGFAVQPAGTQAASVSFTRPGTMGATEINGVSGVWIRVRIAGGGYGTDALYVPVLDGEGKPVLDKNSNQPVYSLTPATYAAPSIKSLELSYEFVSPPAVPLSAITENDFVLRDVSLLAARPPAIPEEPQAAAASPGAQAAPSGPDALVSAVVAPSAIVPDAGTGATGDAAASPDAGSATGASAPVDAGAAETQGAADSVTAEDATGSASGPDATASSAAPDAGASGVAGGETSTGPAAPPLPAVPLEPADESGFVPFVADAGDPALYLGFRRPGGTGAFGDGGPTLYFSVEEPRYAAPGAGPVPAPPVVEWEYWAGAGWKPLQVTDETQAFTRRGTVGFIPPADLKASAEFGQAAHWVRARLAAGGYVLPPRLRGVALNTVWAVQRETVRGEELGSSNGERSQVFRLARSPVLPGEAIEVREPTGLSAAELRVLQAEEGADCIRTVHSADGGVETWVRWHRVQDFLGSGPRSRHYMLDWSTGDVRFGDGVRGMVPPQGRGAVRAAHYAAGGGAQGNRPAGNVAQLRSTVPFVDRVSNPEAAAGGSAAETMDGVRYRGPRTLRHGGRAVALSDYEDLAMAASPEVAVATAVPPVDRTAAGGVQLLVVPASPDPRPVPSVELLERVRAYVGARMPPTVVLEVAGPRWLSLNTQVQVVPVSPEAAHGLADAVRAALAAFLHPLTGGPDGQGWAMGRRPYRSELFALIEGLPGVDHLRSLTVQLLEDGHDTPPPAHLSDRLLVYSGTHDVQVSQGD